MDLNYWNRPFSNDKYKDYYRTYQDDGYEVVTTIPSGYYTPDFWSRNTIQTWDVSNASAVSVLRWNGATLVESSLHTLTIVNNGTSEKQVTFSGEYVFPDENFKGDQSIKIGPGGSAFFYCTALYQDGTLLFALRKGSQDDRKI
jgi:hypothetical protein